MSATALLAIVCGAFSGLALGLVGGGGSILGTPLLLYAVGVGPVHRAIGTGAVAVAVAALANFAAHARAGNVRWRSALVFAGIGIVGALIGAALGKSFDGQKLLFLFGLVMIAVGIKMLRHDNKAETPLPGEIASDVAVGSLALLAGMASGFFGIGGGVLVVPCLLLATQMPMINAVASSLLAVAAFSTATAASYAHSGLVDWPVAGWFIIGGIAGGIVGVRCATRMTDRKDVLRKIFGVFILALAIYVIGHSVLAILRR